MEENLRTKLEILQQRVEEIEQCNLDLKLQLNATKETVKQSSEVIINLQNENKLKDSNWKTLNNVIKKLRHSFENHVTLFNKLKKEVKLQKSDIEVLESMNDNTFTSGQSVKEIELKQPDLIEKSLSTLSIEDTIPQSSVSENDCKTQEQKSSVAKSGKNRKRRRRRRRKRGKKDIVSVESSEDLNHPSTKISKTVSEKDGKTESEILKTTNTEEKRKRKKRKKKKNKGLQKQNKLSPELSQEKNDSTITDEHPSSVDQNNASTIDCLETFHHGVTTDRHIGNKETPPAKSDLSSKENKNPGEEKKKKIIETKNSASSSDVTNELESSLENEIFCDNEKPSSGMNVMAIMEGKVDEPMKAAATDVDFLDYMAKAHQYLKRLQIQKNRSIGNSDNETDNDDRHPLLNITKGIPVKLNEPVLMEPMEWHIRKRNPTLTEYVHHGSTFYTGNPGYRVQLRALVERMHGDIYFSIRLMKGVFDDHLHWPFQERFVVKLSDKMKVVDKEEWVIPQTDIWQQSMRKPERRKQKITTEWVGPFNISRFLDAKKICFETTLAR